MGGGGGFRCRVEDDGIGAAADSLAAKGRFGVRMMRSRAEAMGWELDIRSVDTAAEAGRPAKGTIVEVSRRDRGQVMKSEHKHRVFQVLLVDDHPHGREGMREILSVDPEFQVIGEAVNGEEAVIMAEQLAPDLILMDINMPGIGGLEATQRIKEKHPQVKIVMVTVSDDITFLFEAIKRGAQGYLLKNLATFGLA